MNHPHIMKTAGWITLGALLALAPQLTACDTTDRPELTLPAADITPQSPEKTHSEIPKAAPADVAAGQSATSKAEDLKAQPQKPAVSDIPRSAPFIKRLVIASEVKEREPVEMTEGKVSEPVVAFVELAHAGKNEEGVVVTFEHESGKKVGFVELAVPAESPRYRTWARTRNIDEPGTWTAVVTDRDGEELGRKSFTITG